MTTVVTPDTRKSLEKRWHGCQAADNYNFRFDSICAGVCSQYTKFQINMVKQTMSYSLFFIFFYAMVAILDLLLVVCLCVSGISLTELKGVILSLLACFAFACRLCHGAVSVDACDCSDVCLLCCVKMCVFAHLFCMPPSYVRVCFSYFIRLAPGSCFQPLISTYSMHTWHLFSDQFGVISFWSQQKCSTGWE